MPQSAARKVWFRGGGPRHQSHDRRAEWLRNRIGHNVRAPRPAAAGLWRSHASLANILSRSTSGDPKATASALFRIVDAAEPPLRVFFGDAGLTMIKREYAECIATWEKWNDVSREAQGNLAGR